MMKKCVAVLFSDIDNDSRAKRNFNVLSKVYQLEVLALKHSEKSYNFPVHCLKQVFKKRRSNSFCFIMHTLVSLAKRNPDVVFAEGLMPLIPTSIYAFFFRKKLIYDGRELYIQDEKGQSSYSKFHHWVEKLLIRIPAVVISANEARSEILTKTYHLEKTPVVVKNIPSPKNVTALALPNEFQYLAHGGDFIIYQGLLGKLRDLDKFVRCMVHLPEQVKLILIVKGTGVAEIKKITQELNVSHRVHIHDFVDHDVLYTIMRYCKLGIISYELKGPNNEYCAPNKLYEYAQCHLPMITSPQRTFMQVFEKHKIGKHIDREAWLSNDYETIARNIKEELSRTKDLGEFERFNQLNNWKNEEDRFLQVLK